MVLGPPALDLFSHKSVRQAGGIVEGRVALAVGHIDIASIIEHYLGKFCRVNSNRSMKRPLELIRTGNSKLTTVGSLRATAIDLATSLAAIARANGVFQSIKICLANQPAESVGARSNPSLVSTLISLRCCVHMQDAWRPLSRDKNVVERGAATALPIA